MKKLLKPRFASRGAVSWIGLRIGAKPNTDAYTTLREELYNFFLINLYNLHPFRAKKMREEIEKNR